MIKIKSAAITDAKQIAKVHVDSWKTTYKNIVPDTYLNNLSYDNREQMWHKLISEQSYHVYVAIDESNIIVAFIAFTINQEKQGHISSLYTFEAFQGLGIGKKLLCTAFTYFVNANCSTVTVDVLEENKAKDFYYHLGAKLKEDIIINIGGKDFTELILEWTTFNA